MKTNKKRPVTPAPRTHEGAIATRNNPIGQLKRSACTALLWENQFYEDGASIADRVKALVPLCNPKEVADLAIHCREEQKLRHMPLLLMRELARHPKLNDYPQLVSKSLARVIQRADELSEFVSLYWSDGKVMLSKQTRRGLGWALRKFSEYELGKYKGTGNEVRPRDVLFLTHPLPKDETQAALWKKLADDTLAVPDTWEVALSKGADKKETFTRLIQEKKLGYFALLRNLRNMVESGVDSDLVKAAILARKGGADRVLPFRFIAAARYAPSFERELDVAMQAGLGELPKLAGRTHILVDVSGSMDSKISEKSDLTRIDAACGVAIVARGVCEDVRVFSFSNNLVEVPPRSGMALRDAIASSQHHGGTEMYGAVEQMNKFGYDRLIVISDEQTARARAALYGSAIPNPLTKLGYMINVASAEHGVGYGAWNHIDGWSDAVMKFIAAHEAMTDG